MDTPRFWIDINAEVMGGKPCIRDTRVTVGTIVELIASGYEAVELLEAFPYLSKEDLLMALAYDREEQQRTLPKQEQA